MPNDRQETLEDVKIIFKNFAGKEGKFNAEGDRNFCVLLEEKKAKELDRKGWTVKALKAREDGDPDQPYLPVSVNYKKGRPPKIVVVTSGNRTTLSEREVEMLDYADILKVDLIVNPYSWSVNGNSGIKAYLKTMFVTIDEDELDRKYSD